MSVHVDVRCRFHDGHLHHTLRLPQNHSHEPTLRCEGVPRHDTRRTHYGAQWGSPHAVQRVLHDLGSLHSDDDVAVDDLRKVACLLWIPAALRHFDSL